MYLNINNKAVVLLNSMYIVSICFMQWNINVYKTPSKTFIP